MGIPIMVLTSLLILSLYFPFLELGPVLAVDLCICFHQLLDEGSVMTIKVVINLIMGKASSGTCSPTAWGLSWGHTCAFLGIFLVSGFVLAP